jgi:hypothetical protein
MQYVLGNMLNGAGGLNPDGLSLDLQFAADKTLTARKGPTPVFTRGSTGTFVGSNGLIQSAAINAARFDHDPVTFASRGLLIEESRTNICLQSENFGTTWAAGGCAVSVNTDVAPDGNTTADSVNITNAAGHFLAQSIAVSASTAYTFSFWVKRGTATALSYSVFNNTAGSNIVAPTSYYSQTSSAWARVSFTFTTPVGCTSIAVYMLRDGGSTGTVLLWGAQLEAGSFPTSYIPTTTGTLARSADVCSYTDVSSFYNPAAGTLVGDLILYTPSPSVFPELFRFGGGNNRIQFGVTNVAGEAIRPFITSGGTQTYSSAQGTTVAGTSRKVAITFATNDAISCLNGTLGTQDTSVTMPVSISTAFIGVSFTGHIAAIRYYRKRLPNAKIQSLTA